VSQLYAKELQLLKRHQKDTKTSASTVPLINITNVLPAPSCQTYHLASSLAVTPALDMPSKSTLINRLNIPST
jgi:hypothetical protein